MMRRLDNICVVTGNHGGSLKRALIDAGSLRMEGLMPAVSHLRSQSTGQQFASMFWLLACQSIKANRTSSKSQNEKGRTRRPPLLPDQNDPGLIAHDRRHRCPARASRAYVGPFARSYRLPMNECRRRSDLSPAGQMPSSRSCGLRASFPLNLPASICYPHLSK